MSVTVITACYGEDTPQEQVEQDIDVRWICVTDRVMSMPRPWRAVYAPRPHLSPRMAAHVVKCRPDIYDEQIADVIVWVDASATLLRPNSLETFVEPLHRRYVLSSVATLRHPDRETIAEEWPEAAKQGRYESQPLEEQVRHYGSRGFIDDRLYATTVMAYRRSGSSRLLGDRWLLEQLRWTCQDQISLPYVEWATSVKIATCEENLWTTPHIALRQRVRDI